MPKAASHRRHHQARAPVGRPVLPPAPRNHHPIVSQSTGAPKQRKTEETQMWQMRWYFFWICVAFCFLGMAAALTASIVVFCLTKNFLSLTISAGAALPLEFMRRFANYLLK